MKEKNNITWRVGESDRRNPKESYEVMELSCPSAITSSVTQSYPTLCNPMDCSSQASLSITNSQTLLKLMSVESVMPSNHLILCPPPLLLPSILPSIRVLSNGSFLQNRWPKYRSFSISSSNEYLGLIPLGLTCWISWQSRGLSRVFSNTSRAFSKHQFFGAQVSLWSNSHIHT